ncbi:carboxypeptidase-like regulatory domain-containing protein [Brumimicrobium mesophilum]|uniref:carboxypeptidase-like regulatory domain-containing protein n=1 Tax=Brumimicrobium mesophilum TaxID=392717 RepID=UPI00131B2F06|nr:carboxypeptidase-like regulatory domain-containing protein [Brumimicrobium mesophilum]
MIRYFIFILSISTFNLYSQNSVEFTILNEEQKAIPFANVYCTSTKTGGYSDLNGKLTIKDLNKKDTLRIKSSGYEEKLIVVSEISDTIILNIKTIDFEEFTIKSEYERNTYGVTRKTFFKSRSRGGYIGYREGIVMDIVEDSRLENVELYIENKEDSSRTKFSLMIYSVTDLTDIPKESLLMEKVFLTILLKAGLKLI